MKQTQCEAILAYLRKHKRATNMELVTNLRIASPWKRIEEFTGMTGCVRVSMGGKVFGDGRREAVTRSFIKTPSGKRVVQYRLERV